MRRSTVDRAVGEEEKMGASGKVYLVGGGPGDPGLLTLKGRECLRRADVVVYDYLAGPALLKEAARGAERIYVGKTAGAHTMSQEEICRLLVEKARDKKVVVRLKGGDPFIFGRGGEEAEELAKERIPFEIVPGVTSAIAVPAYGGFPLTHRDHTATVAFITGHEAPGKEQSGIDWKRLSRCAGTLVFLMGMRNIRHITESLMANGRPPDTPVAVIRRGTTAEQRTVTGVLGDIAGRVEDAGLKPPAIIAVGSVVSLRETLNWFEERPLFGKRIIVTRAREQASEFLKNLAELGADCVEFPTIEVVPPEDPKGLDEAVKNLDHYNWILFTSVNGVTYFLERLERSGRDIRDLKGLKIGAIGPKTARAWISMGIKPDLVPDEYRAEAVIAGFKEHAVEGLKILLPRAAEAREILPEELRKMGASVDVVEAYRTIMPDHDTAGVRAMLESGTIHMVTFTSSSTVKNFAAMFGAHKAEFLRWMERVAVACIGPVTAETARNTGFSVDVIPPLYTIESLTEAVVEYHSR